MYIFGIIIKFLKKVKSKRKKISGLTVNIDTENVEDCQNHIYLPIDSSSEYLACKNCGHIIKNTFKNKV